MAENIGTWAFNAAVLAILAKWIVAYILRLVFGRLAVDYRVIKYGHSALGLWPDLDWSGKWEVTWEAVTDQGPSINVGHGEIYRFLNRVAIVSKPTAGASQRMYLFVGELSRDETVVTGWWRDYLRKHRGYHGTFQVRRAEEGGAASGKWLGFSQEKNLVRTGDLRLRKLPAIAAESK